MSDHPRFNVFSGNPLDRAANQRRDADWLAARLAAPDSRFVPLWQLNPFVAGDNDLAIAWQAPAAVRSFIEDGATCIFLGLNGETAHFAVDVSRLEAPEREGPFAGAGDFAELRGLAPRLPTDQAAILAQARALIDWHARHGFCAVCGRPTRPREGGYVRVCTDQSCGTQHFPRTDPVVIMLVLSGDRCLLGRQARFPTSMFSALAGFMEPGETIEEAVAREVFEEAGVTVDNVRYHSSQPWPFPASLMIGCYADATSEDIHLDSAEIDKADWFSRDSVRAALDDVDPTTGLKMPPSFAIAHQLARGWVDGNS